MTVIASGWTHTNLTPCHSPETCPAETHFWPGGAPGPVVSEVEHEHL